MEPDLSLVQERLVTRFESRLEPDAIAVTEQDGTAKRSYRVPLENLAAAPVEVTIWSKPKLWAAGVFMALSAGMVILEVQGGDVGEGAAVFYGVLAAIAVLLFVRSRQTYLVVEGTPALVLMKDRPTPHAMREFLARVQARKREYLAEQYLLGTHEGALVDATHKLDTLRKQGSISDTEVEALKADIIRRAQTTHPPQASPN